MAKKRPEIVSLIIAGGEGLRLWPLSTPENPKPFIKLIGNKTFLRMAYDRALTISPKEKIFISTLESLANHVFKELPRFPRRNLILEPMPKNTAPAIALAAMILKRFGSETVMAVLPADHYIEPKAQFKKAVFKAAKKAQEGDSLLVFGIKPEHPSTEYGYIEIEKVSKPKDICKVERFTEKPNSKKAKSFLRKGNYFWNSGMFVWRIDVFLHALEYHAPDIFKTLWNVTKSSKLKVSRSVLRREFKKIKPISIDYAIMEKAGNCYMTELEAVWKDFGSWDSIDEYFRKSNEDNFSIGSVLAEECRSNTFWSENGNVCAMGVNNMIVVLVSGNLFLINKEAKIDPKRIKRQIERLIHYVKK